MLTVRKLDAFYGEIQTLHGIDLDVREGEVVSVVGANAAGKTTLLNAISGTVERYGRVSFFDQDIGTLPPHAIARHGLVQVPEGRRLFPFMTVRENLELGAFAPHARAHRAESLEKVFDLMPRLRERSGQLAGSMSGGEQQMCAIGRALMAKPRAIMFDEPTLGLAPIMVDVVFKLVRGIKETGITILLVEQNVKHSLAMSDRGYVLENGHIVLSGPAADLLTDPRLKEAYLGG
ncbi:ABC transporter ATP-binding protein [Azospirillum sp. Vi22]|uniref:ABC transporter ATP-binding protein n=1 Tax=Azospirillum baldaniorum TaxID=1064539 RepID=UPI0011A4F0B1|nr:ABC transporter ATP-binding protein [Azospirillum baldaniorum]NUB06638.1 ABC transporter ATP-binding protein [Azospirillum baldaniorum]TWA58028.1 amino acid/amide ABC transporter ATP-binding protein 2 (HAAT family) [Azospirillum baldaniorum]